MVKRIVLIVLLAVVFSGVEVATAAKSSKKKSKKDKTSKISVLETKVAELESKVDELQNPWEPKNLAVDLDFTFVSKYIWRGYNVFGSKGAFQPSVNLDLGTGWSVNVWGSIPMGTATGINQWQEYDYTVAYGWSWFEDSPLAMDFGVNYIYYDFPKLNRFADTQEVGMSVALPNLINISDIAVVPSYYVGKLFPTKSGVGGAGGFHTFALSCDLPIPSTEQTLSFYGDLNYTDGMLGVGHDLTHGTIGVSTSFDVKGITITPSLNYQGVMNDMDDALENALWGGLSLAYSF